jgi:DNA-binding GntR family transcriptional regulator
MSRTDVPPQPLPEVLSAVAGSVRVQTTAQRTAEVLRSAILAGQIERGTVVSESVISAELGVSRNTAREALRLLTGEGLVSQEPHHSPIVTVLEPEDVADVFTFRTILELAAADLIAARAGAVDFRPLERAVAKLAALARTTDDLEVLEADREFHAGLVACAASPRLLTAYSRLESEIRLCLSISTRSHGTVQELVDQHSRFLGLLKSGQFAEFKADLQVHMDAAVRRVTRALVTSRETSPGDDAAAIPAPGFGTRGNLGALRRPGASERTDER